MLLTGTGKEITEQDIVDALATGKAVLCHSYTYYEGGIGTMLVLDGEHYDTRNQCHSVWDEGWTTTPESLDECLKYARCE